VHFTGKDIPKGSTTDGQESSNKHGYVYSYTPHWIDRSDACPIPYKCALVLPGFYYHAGSPNEPDHPPGEKMHRLYPRMFAKVESDLRHRKMVPSPSSAKSVTESTDEAEIAAESIGHPIPSHIKLYEGLLEAVYDYLSDAVKNEIPRPVPTTDLDKCSDADAATESDATESASKKPQAKKRAKNAKSSTT